MNTKDLASVATPKELAFYRVLVAFDKTGARECEFSAADRRVTIPKLVKLGLLIPIVTTFAPTIAGQVFVAELESRLDD